MTIVGYVAPSERNISSGVQSPIGVTCKKKNANNLKEFEGNFLFLVYTRITNYGKCRTQRNTEGNTKEHGGIIIKGP